MKRRTFLTASASVAAGALGADPASHAQSEERPAILVDPAPRFELSPYLFMQFMEPLGATDGSVEAAWDHLRQDWRDDVVAITSELGPTMMRWGGPIPPAPRAETIS
jgi:alpha-N-arabinofuranosidase